MATECRRCLLSEDIPGVTLAADGECSVCKAHDAHWGDWNEVKQERQAELEGLLAAAKRARRRYDALVPISGGKDSVYVLYLARRRYGLKCLAVTFDNGFLSDHARGNIERAVDALETDHVLVRLHWPTLRRLYRAFFLKTGFFCPVCMRGINFAIQTAMDSHRIPVVLRGTSRRSEEHIAAEFFVSDAPTPDFFRAVMEKDPLAAQSPPAFAYGFVRRVLNRVWSDRTIARYHYGVQINLPDYVDWDYDVLYETITKELGWRAHKPGAEHTDCRVDPTVDYIRHRKYPALVPELTRYSKLVTMGKLTKEEARRRLDPHGADAEPESLRLLLETLDITREQFEQVLSDRSRHMPYLAVRYPTLRSRVKGLVRRVTGAGGRA